MEMDANEQTQVEALTKQYFDSYMRRRDIRLLNKLRLLALEVYIGLETVASNACTNLSLSTATSKYRYQI